jgi:PAT family acetyl-CoA transporter-like MFS transporter 1
LHIYSTVQFVGITAFHTQIADPLIGGTYMTVSAFVRRIPVERLKLSWIPQLLNTVSNLGGTWPKVRCGVIDSETYLLTYTTKPILDLQPVVLKGIDYFSQSTCRIKAETGDMVVLKGQLGMNNWNRQGIMSLMRSCFVTSAAECISDHGRALCAQEGGVCITERDGYYAMSMICIAVGIALLVGYVLPIARRLQSESGSVCASIRIVRESQLT